MYDIKRFLILCAVALSLGGGLSGCTTLQKLNDIAQLATTDIQQPVTRKMYRNVSNGLIVTAVALNIYKEQCEDGTLAESCIAVVEKMQSYTTRGKTILGRLRVFVRKNDQVNAKIAYREITQLIADLRMTAAANGIGVK